MFHLDPTDPTPAEVQLVRTIRSAISAGLLTPGEQLPTVRQLAVELRANANAVEKAYVELEKQGVVQTRAGIGTFVSASAGQIGREALLEELSALEDSFLRGAGELGFTLDEIIIHLDSRRGGDTA